MKAKNPVVWFEIYVDDINRAQKFYETVLDIQLYEMPMPGAQSAEMKMLAFPIDSMHDAGAGGTLVKMNGYAAGGNSTIVYFESEDCAVEEGRIEKAGGKIVQSKQSIGEYGAIVLALDSEGNTFGLHSQR